MNSLSALFISTAILTAPLLASAGVPMVIPPTPLIHTQEPSATGESGSVTEAEQQDDQDRERAYHIPLVLNESVEEQLAFFTTRGRSAFQYWLRQSARYISMMKTIFKEYNLPEDLVYVAMIESGFNMQAVSPKKAVGPWQFMSPTGRDYGLNIDQWVDERRDPIKSTHAAAAYLKDLYNMFGSWPLALASYNAGQATVKGAMLRAQSFDFWDLTASRHIATETCTYVPRYMAALVIAKDPVTYGFMAPGNEPFEYDEVVVKKSTHIRDIANFAGCTQQEIKELNPELVRQSTPPTNYIVRIPPGTKEIYESRYATSAQKQRTRQAKIKAVRNALLISRLAPDPVEYKLSAKPQVNIVPRFAAQLSGKGSYYE